MAHKGACVAGNYVPAISYFAKHVQYIMHTLEWNVCFIFDGCRSEAKAPEYARREGNLGNESTYIALAAKVCKDLLVPSVIWELLNDGAMSEEHCHESLHQFVEDAQLFLRSNKFVSHYDAIAMTMTKLKVELIYREYGYIGESMIKKNTSKSLSCVEGTNDPLYHANAFLENHDTQWLISKQMVPMRKGKKEGRNKKR